MRQDEGDAEVHRCRDAEITDTKKRKKENKEPNKHDLSAKEEMRIFTSASEWCKG